MNVDEELIKQIAQHPFEIRQIGNSVFIESPLLIIPEYIGESTKKITNFKATKEGIIWEE